MTGQSLPIPIACVETAFTTVAALTFAAQCIPRGDLPTNAPTKPPPNTMTPQQITRFADSSHLFEWPADLLYGEETGAIATEEPDTIPVEKWDYRRINLGDRRPPSDLPVRAPSETITQIRDRLGDIPSHRPPNQKPLPPSLTRPNPAAAFQQAQNSGQNSGGDKLNPVLAEYPSPVLELQAPTISGGGEPDYSGAVWACRWLCDEVLGSTQLIQPNRLYAWGPQNAGKVLGSYLLANTPTQGDREYLTNILTYLKNGPLAEVIAECDRTMATIEREIGLWAAAGRKTIYDSQGNPDRLLCAVGAVTALVGIRDLALQGDRALQFKISALRLLSGVSDSLREGGISSPSEADRYPTG